MPVGLFPPVSAATTIGTSGRSARERFAFRSAAATSVPPSRTTTSSSGSRIASGQALRRRQLLDLEIAPLEEEARELDEPRVAARDEDAAARLVRVVPERARVVVGARVRGAPRRPGDAVADLEAAPVALAGGELDDLARSAAGRGAPRPHLLLDRDHDLIRVEEDDVDREAHEVRVDRERGAEDHALARIQPAASHQPAHPPVRPVGDYDSARRRSGRPLGGASACPWPTGTSAMWISAGTSSTIMIAGKIRKTSGKRSLIGIF